MHRNMEVVHCDCVYKSWIKSELYGGVHKGGLLQYGLRALHNLANTGELTDNEWKRLILLIKCVRGLYLIPDIVTDVTKVTWMRTIIGVDVLSKLRI